MVSYKSNAVILSVCLVAAISGFKSELGVEDGCLVTDYDNVANATQNCQNIIIRDLFIPGGKQLVLSLQGGAALTFQGNNTFGFWNWTGPLMKISGIGITVQGEEGHVLNGQGELYWDGLGSWGVTKPKFLTIEANESLFKNLNFYNAPVHAITINNSNDVMVTDFLINNAAGAYGVAPTGREGHNTDGFDVKMSTNIIIKDSKVYNQDDCVALNSGSHIYVSNLLCVGSHGLSLSVGFSNDSFEENSLTNILIQNSTIIDAMDGIHIKTHTNAGAGIIANVTYRNIFMIGSYSNGIAIEQNYTNSPSTEKDGAPPKDNIPIKSISFHNIKGTVLNTASPYYIVCAKDGCSEWDWQDVFVTGQQESACVNFNPGGIDCVDYTI